MRNCRKVVIPIILLLPFLAGCKTEYLYDDIPVTLSLKQDHPLNEYSLSSCIDIEEYVNCSDFTHGKCFVSYNGNEKELNGHLYYFKDLGTHTFTYKIGTQEVNFDVNAIEGAINISKKSDAYIAPIGKAIGFKKIETSRGLSIEPSSATKLVKTIDYRPIVIEKFDNYVDSNWENFSFVGTQFTPDKEGEYRINYEVTCGAEKRDFSIDLIAFDSTKKDSKIYFDSVYSLNGVNGGFYKVDGEEVIMHLPKMQTYANATYVALSEVLSLNQGVSVTFKGKNLPQIGMFEEPKIHDNLPFGLNVASGYLLSFEHSFIDRYQLWGPELLLTTNPPKAAVEARNEVFGWSHLKEDSYYMLNATMAPVNANNGYGRAIVFDFYEYGDYGLESQCLYLKVSMAVGYGNYVDQKNIQSGYFGFYSSKNKDVTFKVSTFTSIPKLDYYPSPVKENTFLKNGTYNAADDSFTLNLMDYYNVRDNSGALTGRHVTSSYVALKGDYGEGSEISINFNGRQIPNIGLFNDTFAGEKGGVVGGNGLLFLTTGSRTAFSSEWLSQRLNAYGPHLLETGNASDYVSYGSSIGYCDSVGKFYINSALMPDGRDENNNFKIAYEKLKEDGVYKYVIKIVKANANDGYEINHTLYEKDTFIQTIVFKSPSISGLPYSGNILLYGSFVKSQYVDNGKGQLVEQNLGNNKITIKFNVTKEDK